MMRSTTLAWWAAAGALGCGPDVPRGHEVPPVVWIGENLEYAPQDGAREPCAGTLPYMDRFVGLVAEEMGVELERPLVFVHGDDAEALCDRPVYGCASRDGVVFARGVPQEHELVHGVRSQHGFSNHFFEEGIAEAFGDDMALAPRVRAHGDLVEGMLAGGDRQLPLEWYARAGHFAAFLHEHYGPDVTREVLLRTDRSSTAGMAVTVLEQTTGLTFEQIQVDYSTEPTCTQGQFRYPVGPCSQPVDLRARCDETFELEHVRVDCDDPATLGPRSEGMFRYLVLDVEQDGMYAVTAFEPTDPFASLEIKECTMGCDSIFLSQSWPFDEYGAPVWLGAGRYSIKLPQHSGSPIDLIVRVEGLGCW